MNSLKSIVMIPKPGLSESERILLGTDVFKCLQRHMSEDAVILFDSNTGTQLGRLFAAESCEPLQITFHGPERARETLVAELERLGVIVGTYAPRQDEL